MDASRAIGGLMGAVAALSLCLSPAVAASSVAKQPVRKKSGISLGIGSFTPAAADPRRSAALGLGGFAGSGFRFTPSASPRSRRDVTVAVRARASTPVAATQRTASAAAAVPALAPTAYNLGMSVGWKRFALSGDFAKVDGGLLPTSREALDVGLSYSGNAWSTRLQLGADRSIGSRPLLIGSEESYSVDLGGSYSLTNNLDVTGGVRYKLQLDRLGDMADAKRDSQAVYIGTAFRF